ncbi:hypothetical protein KHO65_gp069 [Mycobacterium phage Sauce]|uniref:Uncharacterized protein n=1 Tax=Mycobacterium phage Sauce TaxID=2419614 RepID=A0A3G3M528_9CAUD|nr:hypothetical protein KHO65_gp069 [Mycobacterium phage Sauce]AYR01496.1 hypothetical protein SEA_SAUCE_70 [Mycobacterium phage Sauce]QKO02155.1 hypothetical protein SEA_RONAN_63 [Mycobacterium phage Ronan]
MSPEEKLAYSGIKVVESRLYDLYDAHPEHHHHPHKESI